MTIAVPINPRLSAQSHPQALTVLGQVKGKASPASPPWTRPACREAQGCGDRRRMPPAGLLVPDSLPAPHPDDREGQRPKSLKEGCAPVIWDPGLGGLNSRNGDETAPKRLNNASRYPIRADIIAEPLRRTLSLSYNTLGARLRLFRRFRRQDTVICRA